MGQAKSSGSLRVDLDPQRYPIDSIFYDVVL
jgi:hypothetical protein